MASPWKQQHLLDSQMLIRLAEPKRYPSFPYSYLREQVRQSETLQEVCPWFAAYELSKQHKAKDADGFHRKLVRLCGERHPFALNTPSNLEGLMVGLDGILAPELKTLSELTMRLYDFVEEVASTKSLNRRRDFLAKFLSGNNPQPNTCHGLDVYLQLLLAIKPLA